MFCASVNAVMLLANESTMRNQLESIDKDKLLMADYYPSILAHAGQEKNPLGVVMIFNLV